MMTDRQTHTHTHTQTQWHTHAHTMTHTHTHTHRVTHTHTNTHLLRVITFTITSMIITLPTHYMLLIWMKRTPAGMLSLSTAQNACIFLHVCVCACVCMRASACVCACACVCVCARVWVTVYICRSVYVCLNVHMHAWERAYVWVGVCTHVCMGGCEHITVCLYTGAYVYTYSHIKVMFTCFRKLFNPCKSKVFHKAKKIWR